MAHYLELEDWVQDPMAFFWIGVYFQFFFLYSMGAGWYLVELAPMQPAWANSWMLIGAIAAGIGMYETIEAFTLYIASTED